MFNTSEEQPRPKRQAALPLRYRDTISDEVVQDNCDNNKPDIFVSNVPIDNSTDVPLALNIEILGVDGDFFLSEINEPSDKKSSFDKQETSDQSRVLSNCDVYPSSINNTQNYTNYVQNNHTLHPNLEIETPLTISAPSTSVADNIPPLTSTCSLSMNNNENVINDGQNTHPDEETSEISFMEQKSEHTCLVCGARYKNESRYYRHLQRHGKVSMHCTSCRYVFDDPLLLEKHQREAQHSGIGVEEIKNPPEGSISCSKCDPIKVFVSKEGYDKHMSAMHGSGREYSCHLCYREFVYAHSLKAHAKHCPMLTDNSITPHTMHKCTMCHKQFRHNSSLTYHIESSHGNGTVYVCSECGSSFNHRSLLLKHKMVHRTDRPYQCGTCLKKFKTRSSLMSHAVTHSSVKKYTCEYCNKQFAHVGAINAHVKIHTGQKWHQCTTCDKKFIQLGNLHEHNRIHTGEKPYHCNVCGKKFRTSSQVKSHLKVHIRKKSNLNVSTSDPVTDIPVPLPLESSTIDSQHHKLINPDGTRWIVSGSEEGANVVYLQNVIVDNGLPSSSVDFTQQVGVEDYYSSSSSTPQVYSDLSLSIPQPVIPVQVPASSHDSDETVSMLLQTSRNLGR